MLSLAVLISPSSSPPSTRHLAFYVPLSNPHAPLTRFRRHSSQPLRGTHCRILSSYILFRHNSEYRGAQASKASAPLADSVERAEYQWHTREFTKTGSALSASIVHASYCLMSAHFDPQAASGHHCDSARGSDSNRMQTLFHSRSHSADFSRAKSISCAAICAWQDFDGAPPAQHLP